MHFSRATRVVAAGALAAAALAPAVATAAGSPASSTIKHVLLISVDGMHQSDLAWYVANHPNSALAGLTKTGTQYSDARTSNPSDSDPGGTALMTGGNPGSTGIYYDVEYSHVTDEAGAKCVPGQAATGGDVIYDSPDDKLANVPDFIDPVNGNGPFPAFDANGTIFPKGVDKNPAAIMDVRNDPSSLNKGTFPVDPASCQPITPWDYDADNSIFQVIHSAGLRTAWSDKHPVYLSFNGPDSNAKAIDDFFAPEIDSQAVEPNGVPYPQDDDWAHIDVATQQYDGYKVQAVLNEIDGLDHSGKQKVGTPAVMGMNFQAVSVAEKLKTTSVTMNKNADGTYTVGTPVLGGYAQDAAGTFVKDAAGNPIPGPALKVALDSVDAQLGRMVAEINKDGLAGSTAIIVTAKHGQSAQDPNKALRIDDSLISGNINTAWQGGVAASAWAPGVPAEAIPAHPGATLIVAGTNDDLWQSYLSDSSAAAGQFVTEYLWNHTAQGRKYDNSWVTVQHSGLAADPSDPTKPELLLSGNAVAQFFGAAIGNGHNPDVFGEVQEGVLYTGGKKKIAEHGGMNEGDTHVLMVVNVPGGSASVQTGTVHTAQVAPTILSLLGLDPTQLRAVQVEGTKVLPGIS